MGLDDGLKENSIYYSHAWFMVFPNRTAELPLDMVLFWWKQDDRLNAVCYRSVTDNASFSKAFKLDLAEAERFYLKPNGNLDNNYHLYDVLEYSGDDYVLVFRLEDDKIISGRPQPIKHEYELKPIVQTGLCVDSKSALESHEMIEKYYELFHLGNKKAEQALHNLEEPSSSCTLL